MKMLTEMYLWTRKTLLNLGSYPRLDLELGIFEGFFTIARQSICHNLAHISEKLIFMTFSIRDSRT